MSLEQGLRTLRGIQQRYDMGRNLDSGYVRSYVVQVALSYADMLWIAAAIEALEKAVAATEALDPPLRSRGRSVTVQPTTDHEGRSPP